MTATLLNDVIQSTCVVTPSPAKINLTLNVLRRRRDGFHDIESLILGVEFFDSLEFRISNDPGIRLHCSDPSLPTDDRNLIVRAALAVAQRSGDCPGVEIELTKRIPVAAGLGGGSGNAATTLRVLNGLWDAGLSEQQLEEIGAMLGSDVPAFFHLPSAYAQGRGEVVRSIALQWSGWAVLVSSGVAVSTSDVYAAWRPEEASSDRADHVDCIVSATTAREIAAHCLNDLEPAIFRVAPIVEELHRALIAAGGRDVRITGAGQTAFVLFDDVQEADFFRNKVTTERIGHDAFVVKTMIAPPTLM